jgi:transposase
LLRRGAASILLWTMRKRGFLTTEDLQVLGELARRANALILLDRGMSCRQVASLLLLDGETVRGWRLLFEADGVGGLAGFHYGGRQAFLTLV